MTTNKPEVFRFHCHGRSAPAYSCNKPADNSGEYVRLAEYEALQAECEKLKAGETSVRDALDGYDNHAEPAHEIVKSIRHRHDSFVDTICDLKARVAELEEGIARCRQQASYCIGNEEALKNQLSKVRDIANDLLAAHRKGGE